MYPSVPHSRFAEAYRFIPNSTTHVLGDLDQGITIFLLLQKVQRSTDEATGLDHKFYSLR